MDSLSISLIIIKSKEVNLPNLNAFQGNIYLHSLIRETKHSAVFKISDGAAEYALKIFKFSDPNRYYSSETILAQEQTNAFYFAEARAYSSLRIKAFAKHIPAVFGSIQLSEDMESMIAREFQITSWNRTDRVATLRGIILEYIPSVSGEPLGPPMPTEDLRSTLRTNLKQLHHDGFCHNDIKLDNLLFNQVSERIQWIDFSSATRWDEKKALQDRLSLELLLDRVSEGRNETKSSGPVDLPPRRSFRDEFGQPALVVMTNSSVKPPPPPSQCLISTLSNQKRSSAY